jgi:acyl-CoA synthetase (AMP-forming)/AMP-acid ligase II
MQDPVVLAFEDREYRRSELDAYVGGLTEALRSRGVVPGDRVALMSSNRPEFVMALYAIWRAGAAVVLISSSWKRAEVAHALELTEPRHGVGDQPLLGEFLPLLSLDTLITPVRDADVPVPLPDSDAVFVFSSGTTGMPKAVRHTHASFAAAMVDWRTALELGPTDRMQIVTPPSHILGLLNIATALDAGCWLRLHRRFDIDALLSHIEKDRITVEMAVAPIALAIASHPGLEDHDLSSLRYIMWCATPVTESVAREITRRTGVKWVTAYGASELPVLACNRLDGTHLDTVGRELPGVRLRISSLDTGVTLPAGEVGEIVAQSDSVMAGYLPDTETAGAFLGPADDRWYRTGDIGYIDSDGWLHITDRLKEMIKVRGFQVAPAEVEAVLHEHPAVADCAVFGIPDDAAGEAVIAAVRLTDPVHDDELIAFVGDRLASYKRPRRVVVVPEIPRLPSGKVLRRTLKECYGRTSHQ